MSEAQPSGELAAVDECTCGHLWDQHYAAAGRQGFCLSHCGCRGFIGVGRKSAVHLAAGRPEMPDHDESTPVPKDEQIAALREENERLNAQVDQMVWPVSITEESVIRQERDALLAEREWLRALVDRLTAPVTSREAPDGR